MEDYNVKKGITSGVSAYLIWGFLPIYWKLLDHIHAGSVLAHRIIWSVIFMVVFLFITKRFNIFIQECKHIWHNKKIFLIIATAACIISVNWLIFIWAVHTERVIQVSLGYYINPLMSVLLGVLFFKEKLSAAQTFSFILAGIGVTYLTFSYGIFPWVSLSLAITFAVYGLLKKLIHIQSIFSLTIETLLMMPIALIYLYAIFGNTIGFDNESVGTIILLIASGIATAVPLLLFGSAVQFIPLSMAGFLQYIAPTIMLVLGVFLYGEEFTTAHLITFTLIWISLIVFMTSSINIRKKRQEQEVL